MIKAKVYVMLKPSVLDPQGKTVTNALHTQGYTLVKETRISKFIELMFETSDVEEVNKQVAVICNKILANPNTEHYTFELETV